MLNIEAPKINVGIMAASNLTFELTGSFNCEGKTINAGTYEAFVRNNQINTSFCKQKYIHLSPVSHSTFILKKVTIGIGFHWQKQEDQEFEGELALQIEEGKIRAVNVISVEDYLKSVISSEMSAMNDTVLLQVHAIVSRSWLLAQLNKKNSPKHSSPANNTVDRNNNADELIKWYDREDHLTFDVCADDHCQRYQGITKVISKNAEKAVESTHGQVIKYTDEICDARFSKCCGGITESFENVWQPVNIPYLSSVADNPDRFLKTARIETDIEEFIKTSPNAFCNTSDPGILKQVLIDFDQRTTDFYRWKVEYSQEEISKLIARKSGIDFG
ncbi:MAG: SpoIID/LytB domain-containing protein, partial [Prolixibacteraceae bacterium]|nr:SpoIID/LytB domain-containing protein [Prolixibacteraceae bacterium]